MVTPKEFRLNNCQVNVIMNVRNPPRVECGSPIITSSSRPSSTRSGTSTSIDWIRRRGVREGKVGMRIKDNAISSRQRSNPRGEGFETIVITDIWAIACSYSSDIAYGLVRFVITVSKG